MEKSVQETISVFISLAAYIFASRLVKLYCFTWMFNFVASLFRDSRYKVKHVEECYDQVYGRTEKLFDYPSSGRSGTKIAVTATTTSDSTLCIFSNYLANEERKGMCPCCML